MTCVRKKFNKILLQKKKNKTKIEQGYDKKMYLKLVLSRLKVLPLFIPFKDLILKNLHGSFIPMCGPCLPMWPMSGLKIN